MSNKRALIVGINYVGTSNELRGCVNDANLVNKTLTEQYGFTDVRMLLDEEATTKAMLNNLRWLVADAKSGDILYFHYSGHGSQLRDKSGDEADGLDEIICPVDLNWIDKVITDDQLKSIFGGVPVGVNLTVTLDCCNSGGGLDQANQYQALGAADRAAQPGGRFIPPPKYTPEQLAEGVKKYGFKRKILQRNVDATGLMISGCQSHQTSADAYIDGDYIGACTYYLNKTLADNDYKINYKDLVDTMNNDLANAGFTQRPELNGSGKLFGDEFLASTGTPAADVPVEVVEGVTYVEVVEPPKPSKPSKKDDDDDDKGGSKKILLIVAVLAIAAIVFGMSG